MRTSEFQTSYRKGTCGVELFAWAKYWRGDMPTQEEREYAEQLVKSLHPDAELVGLKRRFVPVDGGRIPIEVTWEFKWIDFYPESMVRRK